MMKRKEIDDDKVDAGVLDESSSAESSSDDVIIRSAAV